LSIEDEAADARTRELPLFQTLSDHGATKGTDVGLAVAEILLRCMAARFGQNPEVGMGGTFFFMFSIPRSVVKGGKVPVGPLLLNWM